MSEEIKPQAEESIADLSDGKKWLVGGTGTLAGIFVDAGMMHHNGVGGLVFGTVIGVMTAYGYPVIRPMVDSVCKEFTTIAAKRQATRVGQPKDGQDIECQSVYPSVPLPSEMAATLPLPASDNLVDPSWYAEYSDDEVVPFSASTKMSSDLFTFSEVLASGFVPTVNKIFVGRTMEGKDIFVPAEDLCHVALAGKTGGGKGSLMRLLMIQLCYIGAKVLLLNPHYMRWVRAKDGPKFDEDWTPFEGVNPRTGKPYLEAPPTASADPEPIEKCLRWSLETLLAKRKSEGREGGKLFAPYFIVLDEWPDVVSEVKKAPDVLEKLLRQGRKYGIFVIVASQDFQVKTTGMDGGSVRKCLLTCFYTGGDPTTAKELLYSEKPSSIPENKIGKGTVLLRCTGTGNEAILVKVPFVDNAAVYRLLGQSTFHGAKKSAVVQEESGAPLPQAAQPPPAQKIAQPVAPSRVLTIDQILALYETGKLSEEALLKLIDRLPVVQGEGSRAEDGVLEQELDADDLAPEVIDFQAKRNDRRVVDPVPALQQHESIPSLPRQQHAKYQKALTAWNEGHQTVRSLAAALEITESATYKLMTDMDKLGLIQMKRKAK